MPLLIFFLYEKLISILDQQKYSINMYITLYISIYYNTLFGFRLLMLCSEYISPVPSLCKYRKKLSVYSAYFSEREDLQNGDKVVIPESVYHQLIQSVQPCSVTILGILNISLQGYQHTYCTVKDFKGMEGCIVVPTWMFETLSLQEGQDVQIFSAEIINDLNKADTNLIKFRGEQTNFVDFDRKFIEENLRGYTCLHEGDTILVSADNGKWKLTVLEIIPRNELRTISLADKYVYFQFVEPEKINKYKVKRREYLKGICRRIGRKGKGSQIKDIPRGEDMQFNPRQHRIIRGIRKNKIFDRYKGNKIGSDYIKGR